ncbi:MAG: MaoC family dehydratase N-terminal domain-containing protein [Pseudomonadota bacterium]
MDMLNTQAWVGRVREATGTLSEAEAARIAATLGTPTPRRGDVLPPLWHWFAFPDVVEEAELAEDGHPRRGAFLPPLPLRRRMWAAGALEFRAPARVGEALTCRSTILSVAEKGSPARPMAFVTLEHEVRGPGGLVARERQTLVYLDIPETFTPPAKRAMPGAPDAQRSEAVSAATLFRFSAVTFNAHRIHYDADYTRAVERYPGLVIHGPLQALKLMAFACDRRGRAPSHFEFRGVHPMFLGANLDLAACEDGDGGLRLVAGQDGHQGMTATAIWEGRP